MFLSKDPRATDEMIWGESCGDCVMEVRRVLLTFCRDFAKDNPDGKVRRNYVEKYEFYNHGPLKLHV